MGQNGRKKYGKISHAYEGRPAYESQLALKNSPKLVSSKLDHSSHHMALHPASGSSIQALGVLSEPMGLLRSDSQVLEGSC